MLDFRTRYGPCAVIAGGSHGIGGSFAEQLAAAGLDLVLGARNGPVLDEFAEGLRSRFPTINVQTVVADLSTDGGVDALIAAAEGREVGLFIHNAGTSSQMRPFLELDLEYARNLLQVNAVSMMTLVHHFAGPMTVRRRGGMIIVGSLAGLGGQWGLTSYSAVKAFSRVFCEGFWFEMKQHGVDVLALTPGGVETPSRQRDFPQATGTGMAADAVAREGLENLANGPVYFPGPVAAKAQAIRALGFAEAVEEAYQRNAIFRDAAKS